MKSLSEVRHPGASLSDNDVSGRYLAFDRIVEFGLRKNRLEVVSVDAVFDSVTGEQTSRVLASFPIRHVDLVEKNREITESEEKSHWEARTHIVLDPTDDGLDTFSDVLTSILDGPLERQEGFLQFDISKQLQDGSELSLRYSFKRNTKSSYIPAEYPKKWQDRFGFFKTTLFKLDDDARLTNESVKDLLTRWDPQSTLPFYFAKDFPKLLKPAVRQVFAAWNQALKARIGKSLLSLHENSGQEGGDLRYNLIFYHADSEESSIVGYAPAFTNPRTGEILKADLHFYETPLKQSLFKERLRNTTLALPDYRPMNPLGIPGVETLALASQPQTNAKLLSQVRNENQRLLESLKKNRITDAYQRITRVQDTLFFSNLSDNDDQALIQIFTPLLSHELGHVLGLRHNFMGSADHNHHRKAKSSSVMDYGFSATSGLEGPGQYDLAALTLLYGKAKDKIAVLAKKFLYCTDEHVWNPKYGHCHRYDTGTSLPAIVVSLKNLYRQSYQYNNFRQNRFFFEENNLQYLGTLYPYLKPFRVIFDHSTALLAQIQTLQLGSNDRDKAIAVGRLIALTSGRIVANSDASNTKTYFDEKGSRILIDLDKLARFQWEAQDARQSALSMLSEIIHDSSRADYAQYDLRTDELEVKGVLLDKMLSLLLFSEQTEDPVTGLSGGTFEVLPSQMSTLFRTLLSGTRGVGRYLKVWPYDPNLRRLALDIVEKELINPTRLSGQAIQMLEIAILPASEGPILEGERKQYRDLLIEISNTNILEPLKLIRLKKELTSLSDKVGNPKALDLAVLDEVREEIQIKKKESLGPALTTEELKAIEHDLKILERQRNAIPMAATIIGNKEYIAPVIRRNFGYPMEIATGYLIRSNLHGIEDWIAVMDEILLDLDTEIEGASGAELKNLVNRRKRTETMLQRLHQIAQFERRFLWEMKRVYEGK